LYGIEVQERGGVMRVTLRGELDLYALDELREALDAVARLRGPAVVDLREVTFLDLISARELAVRSHHYGQRVAFKSPSPEACASIEAAGLGGWFHFPPDADRDGPQVFSGVS